MYALVLLCKLLLVFSVLLLSFPVVGKDGGCGVVEFSHNMSFLFCFFFFEMKTRKNISASSSCSQYYFITQ